MASLPTDRPISHGAAVFPQMALQKKTVSAWSVKVCLFHTHKCEKEFIHFIFPQFTALMILRFLFFSTVSGLLYGMFLAGPCCLRAL